MRERYGSLGARSTSCVSRVRARRMLGGRQHPRALLLYPPTRTTLATIVEWVPGLPCPSGQRQFNNATQVSSRPWCFIRLGVAGHRAGAGHRRRPRANAPRTGTRPHHPRGDPCPGSGCRVERRGGAAAPSRARLSREPLGPLPGRGRRGGGRTCAGAGGVGTGAAPPQRAAPGGTDARRQPRHPG